MKFPKTLSKKVVFNNKWLEVKIENVRYSEKTDAEYTYASRNYSGVVVLPYFQKTKSFLLVRQYRHPIGKKVWQFPGGTGKNNFSAKKTAMRELFEETGHTCDKLISLGFIYPDTAILSDKGRVFLAINPIPKGSIQSTPEEKLTKKMFTISQLEELIFDGTIRDGWTLGAYSLFKLWQQKNK